MEEKIGIGKLIELLNEYTKQSYDDYSFFKYMEPTHSFYVVDDGYESYMPEEVIFGKRFGFIKWLVENDKINIDSYEYEIGVGRIGENNEDWRYDKYSDYEKALMLLAIQDEPIRFLCEILK